MAKISFLLHQSGADKPTPIFAFLSFDGKRVKVYAGLSIHPRQWNKDDQRALTRGYPLNGALNDALDLLGERLLKCYADCRAVGAVPTAEQLRLAATPIASPTQEPPSATPASTSLLDAFTAWIEGRGVTRTENTLRTNRTTLRHLREFGTKTRYPLDFDMLTPAFADRFTRYLLADVGLMDSSVRKSLYILKNFLTWANDQGLTDRQDFKKFRWHHREPDILTLTREELAAMANLDLAARPALDNARALFLLSCYTGLRFSDVAALRPEHILPDRIRLTTQKTRDTLTIPTRPEARPLLARLLAGTLRVLPNQKLNAHLKTLGQLAGLDTPTERTRYAGGKRLSTTAPKWEFVTSHTARRTFVTLALEAGIRPEVVMKITGHKDLKSFRRYVNVTEDSALREFARAFQLPESVVGE